MAKKKITKQMLRKWASQGLLDPHRASKATQKHHVHIHGEAAWASIGDITPAEYRRRSKQKRKKDDERRKKARANQAGKKTRKGGRG